MNVMLICPAIKNNSPLDYAKTPPMGLISIATYLSQQGHNVKVIDRTAKVTNIYKLIKEFEPDFVGISLVYVLTIDDARKCSQISQQYGAKVVWGGHLATDVPEIILNENFVDFVMMGEGEFAWGELLQAYENGEDYSGIKGLAYKKNGQILINECREFCNLADIPPMDFSFVNPKDYFEMYIFCGKMVRLYSSKGCPGRCAFCYNAHFHHSVHRKRPIEHVIREIRSLVAEYGADGIYLEDEIFRTNSKDITEACEAFKNSGIDFVWGCKCRIGMLTPEDFRIMYESGCRWIFFGVESASEEMRRNMHKEIKLDDVKPDIANCTKAGILPITSFIIGLPDETCEQLKETVEFIQSLKDSVLVIKYFTSLFGAEYNNKLLAEGKIKPVTKLDDLKEYPVFESFSRANYSKIPLRDLEVVKAHLLWWAIRTKPAAIDDSGNSVMKKAIHELLGGLSAQALMGIVSKTYGIVHMVMMVGLNLFFFPKVKKKYGLKLNRKRT